MASSGWPLVPSNRPSSYARFPPYDARRFSLAGGRYMVGRLGYDHFRQQAGPGDALFDRLRGLGGGPHGALAGILFADILDDHQLRGDVFVALAGFFPDGPQVLRTHRTMLFRIRQIVHDPFPFEMRRQWLTAAAILQFLLGR